MCVGGWVGGNRTLPLDFPGWGTVRRVCELWGSLHWKLGHKTTIVCPVIGQVCVACDIAQVRHFS